MNASSEVKNERRAHSLASTVTAFTHLGKMRLFEIWLGPIIAWSLVVGLQGHSARAAVLCGLFALVIAFGIWATHAFDDITGHRDGSDIRNYAPERRRSQVKPLVAGSLTVRQARVFAFTTMTAALGCVLLFSVVSAFQPWWIFVGGSAVVILGVQYSTGINFSYRFVGGGEAVTGLTLATSLLVPYAAASGRLDAAASVQGLLFGAWLVQVLICSNSADAEDDRRVGRRTVAARTTVRGNRNFVAVFFVASWALALVATLLGVLSPWTPLGLLPAWLLQAHVLRNGLRGRWRNRRNYGFIALRLAVLGLVITNVLG